MTKISVTIITKNEEYDIRDCLESVKWANEIIVLDSGSTDDTVKICRQYTDKVFETDWPGFGPQKNRALEKATGDWILSLDADERVPPELQQEILHAVKSSDYAGYFITRKAIYCGKIINFGTWRNKPVIRLFKKNHGKFTDVLVHENLMIDGKVGKLQAPLVHHTYRNLEEVIEKINFYSTESAKEKLKQGKQGGLFKAIIHGLWAFLNSYVFMFGFLDGKEGFMVAVSNAEYSYYRYVKMMMLGCKDARM